MTEDRSTRSHGSKGVLFIQANGDIICATCKKEGGSACLRWHAESGTLGYRLRPLNPHERLLITSHSEIPAPVRVIAEPAVLHGTSTWVLAEKLLCPAGWLIATGLTTSHLRANGPRLAGRVRGVAGCERCSRRTGRRAPTPLKFRTMVVYDALILDTEPIPKDDVTFLRLVATVARRVRQGEPFTAIIEAYRDDLAHYLQIETTDPADEPDGSEQGDEYA